MVKIRCQICNEVIKKFPLREDDSIRKDSNGKHWCPECTYTFDDIDWDEDEIKYSVNYGPLHVYDTPKGFVKFTDTDILDAEDLPI